MRYRTIPSLNAFRAWHAAASASTSIQNGGFAGPIAQRVQTQILGTQLHCATLQIDLLASGLRFVIGAAQISNESTLGDTQVDAASSCLISACRTLLRRTPQSHTGILRLAVIK